MDVLDSEDRFSSLLVLLTSPWDIFLRTDLKPKVLCELHQKFSDLETEKRHEVVSITDEAPQKCFKTLIIDSCL